MGQKRLDLLSETVSDMGPMMRAFVEDFGGSAGSNADNLIKLHSLTHWYVAATVHFVKFLLE